MKRAAALLASLTLCAGVAGAQIMPKQFSVTTRLGTLIPERAASLDGQALVGLDAEYAISKYFGVGTAIDVSRGNTTRQDFLTRLRFGNAAVAGGDSIYYQFVGQPVNLVNLGVMGTLRYPGKRLTPFMTGGVGSYLLLPDAQINGKAMRKSDLSLTGGVGIWYKLSERAGLQLDVRAMQFQGYSRDFLNPAAGREVLVVPFPEDFEQPPAAKNTALNTMITLGFRYIPGGI